MAKQQWDRDSISWNVVGLHKLNVSPITHIRFTYESIACNNLEARFVQDDMVVKFLKQNIWWIVCWLVSGSSSDVYLAHWTKVDTVPSVDAQVVFGLFQSIDGKCNIKMFETRNSNGNISMTECLGLCRQNVYASKKPSFTIIVYV